MNSLSTANMVKTESNSNERQARVVTLDNEENVEKIYKLLETMTQNIYNGSQYNSIFPINKTKEDKNSEEISEIDYMKNQIKVNPSSIKLTSEKKKEDTLKPKSSKKFECYFPIVKMKQMYTFTNGNNTQAFINYLKSLDDKYMISSYFKLDPSEKDDFYESLKDEIVDNENGVEEFNEMLMRIYLTTKNTVANYTLAPVLPTDNASKQDFKKKVTLETVFKVREINDSVITDTISQIPKYKTSNIDYTKNNRFSRSPRKPDKFIYKEIKKLYREQKKDFIEPSFVENHLKNEYLNYLLQNNFAIEPSYTVVFLPELHRQILELKFKGPDFLF